MTETGWWSLWILVMSFSRCWGINSVNLLIENLLNSEDIFIYEKKFSSGHCLCKMAFWFYRPLLLQTQGEEVDLYSADMLSVPGHFLTHRTWTSWLCSALKLQLTVFFAGFHWIRDTTVWTSLLVLMLHGRSCCRSSTTVPVSMSRLEVQYTNILLIFSFLGVVKILEVNFSIFWRALTSARFLESPHILAEILRITLSLSQPNSQWHPPKAPPWGLAATLKTGHTPSIKSL